ncbi:Fungal specific transcription factor domain containing protein [Naviculisporaceae sp. PSN 640]
MTTRSRQGCDECRRRRRKCDEQKPCCGQCSSFNRICKYTLRVVSVWQIEDQSEQGRPAVRTRCRGTALQPLLRRDLRDQDQGHQAPAPIVLPRQLPNGIPLSSRYQQLLHHFTQDILASLSCHPLVHADLRQGLLPATFESPQLMSACLALSAAGFLSRGVMSLDGVDIAKILGHLQSSGLGLLRTALADSSGEMNRHGMNETLMATCLIWCLTDVFTYNRPAGERKPPASSWRIHLQGIQALLDSHSEVDQRDRLANTDPRGRGSSMQMAMKHLYQLYLSLQTLPYIPQAVVLEGRRTVPDEPNTRLKPINLPSVPSTTPAIDGFLGYSDELLYVLQEINQTARSRSPSSSPDPNSHPSSGTTFESDILLGKVKAMIARDSKATPPVTLSPLTATSSAGQSNSQLQEYALCHRIFQQATLIQLYRQLYHRPSCSPEIQSAFAQMVLLFSQMESTGNSSAEPCHTWVAMAMPLFTLGCEAVTDDQRQFVMAKIDGLEECIRSSHVRIIRQALRDVWDLRTRMGDEEGELCAGELLENLDYNIILF